MICLGSLGSYTVTPRSQSSPSAWMRKMSSVWRSGRLGFASTACERASVSSREMRSGGCQASSLGAMVIALLLGQHQTRMGPRAQRSRASRCQVCLAVEQAREAHVAAAYLGLDRHARKNRKCERALEHVD